MKNRKVLLEGSGSINIKTVELDPYHNKYITVKTEFSVISSGTEGSAVSLGSKPTRLAKKIINDRKKAQQILGVVAQRGVSATMQIVNDRINQETELGYSCSGYVVNDPSGTYKEGQPVGLMGVGFATHSDYNFVSSTMCTAYNGDIDRLNSLAFGGLACICIHALRRSELQPGSEVAIIGLGLLGQITMLCARAMGFFPFGYDLDAKRVAEVKGMGLFAEHSKKLLPTEIERFPAAVICASTQSNQVMEDTCEILRHKGKLIIVGDIPIKVSRSAIYRKEIDLLISTSYGPGRYDEAYETGKNTYPEGYIPWSQGDNLRYFSTLIENGLDFSPLISKIYPANKAIDAYKFLKQDEFKEGNGVALLLDFKNDQDNLDKSLKQPSSENIKLKKDSIFDDTKSLETYKRNFKSVGLVGAGAFARGNYVPYLKKHTKIKLKSVVSGRGVTANMIAKQFDKCEQYSSLESMIKTEDLDSIIVATRNDLHAIQAIACAKAKISCLVEKPICINLNEVRKLSEYVSSEKVYVGFNRRFAPKLIKAKEIIKDEKQIQIVQEINVGNINSHWSADPLYGGRLASEAVHFIDLANWMANSQVDSVFGIFGAKEDIDAPNQGQILVKYKSGSSSFLSYNHSMPASLPKETISISARSKLIKVIDCKKIEVYQQKKKTLSNSLFSVNKGNTSMMDAFFNDEISRFKVPSLKDGLLATLIIEAAKTSSISNRWIDFDSFLSSNGVKIV